MREIKFRGKSNKTDKQQIVYGWGCYTDENGRLFILTDNPVPISAVEVEEIQLYTGLKDKNGKEIYDGDIVKWTSWKLGSHICEEENYKISEVVWRKGAWRWNNLDNWEIAIYDDLEVVGNIYENPELLK